MAGTELSRQHAVTCALGWEGEGFRGEELWLTRTWLGSKALSIAGGTDEVQLNIIARKSTSASGLAD